MQLWQVPDRRSLVAYLKTLSSEELTEWYIRRLQREVDGVPDYEDERCRNGHLRSLDTLGFSSDGSVRCRGCVRAEKVRSILRRMEEQRCG
jgi:hypothetical protein